MQILTAAPPQHETATHGPGPGLLGWGLSGTTVLVLVVIGWALLMLLIRSGGGGRDRALVRALRGGAPGPFLRTLQGVFKGIGWVLRTIGRYLSGRPMAGEPRSTATFWHGGVRTDTAQQAAVALGSIALAPPKVSLVKPTPSTAQQWARRAATWIENYAGRGERLLDGAARAAIWTAKVGRKAGHALTTAYNTVAPVVATLAHGLGRWHCWPGWAKGAARIIVPAAVVGLYLPVTRTWTVLGLVLLAAGAITGAIKFKPTPPGDDAVYGPRLWVVIREDLQLPEDEPREKWISLPPSLAAPDAQITIRLPWAFRGSAIETDSITTLVNSRLPGEWVGRYSWTGEHATAVYTHKPPPKPKPQCPDKVSFFDADIQEAIEQCRKGEIVIGKDENGRIVVRRLDGETPHWALSVGTGGGKSAFNQMVIAQLAKQGYHVIAVDVKRTSVANYDGVPGIHIYNDPKAPQDMWAAVQWFWDEIDARSYVKEGDATAEFPGLLLLVEEANEFADLSKEHWDNVRAAEKEKKKRKKGEEDEFEDWDAEDVPAGLDDFSTDRAADPIWGRVSSSARLGRFIHGNIIAVFQDLRDQALGGKGLRNLFRLKFMGNFNTNQWGNVVGTRPVPDSQDKAGRMMIVEGNSQIWVQTLYGDPDELREWTLQQREATGFDPAAGLWGT
ncbi:hypothetical protein, partial [Streptomyces sp. cg2]|uniref:hypothetical protein n=1 Tax=Streptomyces sp. cg2 TaxID=3238799 RepID=UPI0034E1AA9E